MLVTPPREAVREFFSNSIILDQQVLRPLSHIKGAWDVTWDHEAQRYMPEEGSFAKLLNIIIDEIADTAVSVSYHENEDAVVSHLASKSGSTLAKIRGRWQTNDYRGLLEQGGFDDVDQGDLLTAAIGRVAAAIMRGQRHFDEMEEGHRIMLGHVLTIILYHRSNYEPDDWSDL